MRLKRDPKPARHGGYQEWAEYLDQWAEGSVPDGSQLLPLYREDFAGETWARLADRFTGAINRRTASWQAALSRATDAANSDEFAYGRALQQGRAGMAVVRQLASDARIPEELRTALTKLFDNLLRQMQEQLEDSVQRQRGRGDSARYVEARLYTLRSNPLTAVIAQPSAHPAGWTPPAAEDAPRRRIVRP